MFKFDTMVLVTDPDSFYFGAAGYVVQRSGDQYHVRFIVSYGEPVLGFVRAKQLELFTHERNKELNP